MDDTLTSNLSIDELARRCQQESEKYVAGRPHDETYCLELFHRAIFNHSQEAWRAIYAQYQNLVADWAWQHDRFQSLQKEASVLANAAFTRFWRTVSKQKEEFQFDGLGKILQYLKRCVHTAIEDAHRRQQRRPQETLIWDELSEILIDDTSSPERRVLSQLDKEALEWAVRSRLRNEAEEVVATLSWQAGLKPREIQARRPDLFSNVQRVYRIKRNILERLLRDEEIKKLWRQMR